MAEKTKKALDAINDNDKVAFFSVVKRLTYGWTLQLLKHKRYNWLRNRKFCLEACFGRLHGLEGGSKDYAENIIDVNEVLDFVLNNKLATPEELISACVLVARDSFDIYMFTLLINKKVDEKEQLSLDHYLMCRISDSDAEPEED